MSKKLLSFIGLILFASALVASEQSIIPAKPDNASGIVFEEKLTDEQIKMFYDFAVEEMHQSNFGMARDLFQNIVKKTDKFPLSYYFLAQIYSNVNSMRNTQLARLNYELLVESKYAQKHYPQFVQEAYSNLIDMEADPKKIIKMAKNCIKIEKNVLSLSATLRAYQKMYVKTNEEKYSQLAEVYTQELNQFFNNNNSKTAFYKTSLPLIIK